MKSTKVVLKRKSNSLAGITDGQISTCKFASLAKTATFGCLLPQSVKCFVDRPIHSLTVPNRKTSLLNNEHCRFSSSPYFLSSEDNAVESHIERMKTSPYFLSSEGNGSEPQIKRKQNKTEVLKNTDESRNLDEKRTSSFEPLWAGTHEPTTNVKVHTLILGTHPSITSLSKSQYFGHTMNVFWWIVGDCLGFRRSSGISEKSGKPYHFERHLRYGKDKIISYDEQVNIFTSKGFALWDVVASCERKGSLDKDIQKEKPNSIRDFCENHPSVKRIVMANGSTQCAIFNRHFKSWWESGALKPARNEKSLKAFQKFGKVANNFESALIECVCCPGVSPAAAKFTYQEKFHEYEKYCFRPGLLDHEKLNIDYLDKI